MRKHSSYDNANVNRGVDIPILNEFPECGNEPSKKSLSFLVSVTCELQEQDLTTKLKAFRVININRIITGRINIKSNGNIINLLAKGVR